VYGYEATVLDEIRAIYLMESEEGDRVMLMAGPFTVPVDFKEVPMAKKDGIFYMKLTMAAQLREVADFLEKEATDG